MKKEKRTNKTKEELLHDLKQQKYKRVAREIEILLSGESMGLQPYLGYSEFGIAPKVRLVELENKDEKESTESK